MKHLLALSILLLSAVSYGQLKQAEKYIRDLASPEFHGRGYTHDADKKAANYIKDHFEQFGLQPMNDDSYFQEFVLDINTFPDSVSIATNGQRYLAGRDFIIDATSGSANDTFYLARVTPYDKEGIRNIIALDENPDSLLAFVVDPSNMENRDSLMDFISLKYALAEYGPVIWINNEKLTWAVRQEHNTFPIIEVSDTIITAGTDKIYINVNNKFIRNYRTQNVIGYVPATKKRGRKKYKVFTAHYDHLGHMGSHAYIPGANDNASGTAMLLSLAQYYAEHPPKDFNIVFMAFGAEEAGLVGSKYYTEHPLFPLKKIEFLLNLDLMGNGSEGITVVNATVFEDAFQKLVEINNEHDYVVKIKKRGEAANSDHYYFTKKGVPSFFIYTLGGSKAYHDIYDKADALPLSEFEDLFKMFVKFMEQG